jgi:hypothetical protein
MTSGLFQAISLIFTSTFGNTLDVCISYDIPVSSRKLAGHVFSLAC